MKIGSKGIKGILFLLMMIALSAILFIFTGYRHMRDRSAAFVSSVREGSGMSLTQVHQTASKDGNPAWKLNAESVHYMNEKGQAVFENPYLIFFLDNEQQARLRSLRGTVKTDSSDVEMSGNVVMETSDYTMETAVLKYRHESRQFLSDLPVKITGTHLDLTADSAFLDLNAGKLFFKGNVKGTFSENISL